MIFSYENYITPNITPQQVIHSIGNSAENAFFTTDVGQHQMWSAQLINCQPKKWITSAGLGTMGFALPAAMGAKMGALNREVVAIIGDGGYQMTIQELGTIFQLHHQNLPLFSARSPRKVKTIVMKAVADAAP